MTKNELIELVYQVLVAGMICLATFALYSINLEQIPHPDELYHLLAAKGLLATGEPAIGEGGRYWRGFPLTWLVAQSMALFGQSLGAGRLPAVLFMSLLCAALYLFLRREAGRLAAWLGTGLFALSPFAIDLARFIRFYSLQCLLFFLAAWLVHVSFKNPEYLSWRILPKIGVAAGLLLFAVYLQPTTLFGIAGLGTWVLGVGATHLLADPRLATRQKTLILAATAALVGLAALLAWQFGFVEKLMAEYRYVQIFNEANADRFWFYLLWYTLYYPILVLLSVTLFLHAYRARPRLTMFLAVVFLVGFLLNSFAAAKSLRYIAYAQAMLFALWGVGLAALLAGSGERLHRLRYGLRARLRPLAPRRATLLADGLLAGAALLVILANPAWLRSLALLAGLTLPMQVVPTDWAAAAGQLRPMLERADVVVTTEELGPLYYYDRADILLSATKYAELPPDGQAPFTPDSRTGVPTIETAASLERVMSCYASGLFLTQAKHWGEGATLRDPEVEALILRRAVPVELPARSQVVAFAWGRDAAGMVSTGRDCTDLPPSHD